MKIVNKIKAAYERQERVNAIKAMKKADRTEEQAAELKQWKKEEKRNTAILVAGIIVTTAVQLKGLDNIRKSQEQELERIHNTQQV